MNKFYKIYLELKEMIDNNTYQRNTLLPSENDLARQYGVSRETIRKALVLLLEIGYIHKIQGKGSIVLDTNKSSIPITGLVSFKELQESQHKESNTKVIINESIAAPDFLVELNLIKPDEKIIYLVRQRIMEDESVILDKDYIRASLVSKVPNNRAEESLYNYLETDLGIKVSYANKHFNIEKVTEEDKLYIDLHDDEHVAVVRSDIYTEGTDFLHYTESRHRVDKFQFSEFARRTVKK